MSTSSEDLPIIPIGVKDAPFAFELFAHDCPPTQFVREMTRNGIEAVEAYRAIRPGYRGEIIWTVDPVHELFGTRKLACIDTGVGMSAEEMTEYLNDLTASSRQRSLAANYGIGAKVSAAAVNPHGVMYLSWRGGAGHMIELGRDRSGIWGMRQHRLGDGSIAATMPIDEESMPEQIRAAGGHGTMVVFLGESEEHDTTLPPVGETGERWLARAINQRFYELPDYATIKVREVRSTGITFRQARGQRYHLDQCTIASGVVEVTGATIHWRILDGHHEERRKESGVWASTGHRAALLDGELFELATAARGGYQKVQEFGIRFGYERVVLYVEPHSGTGRVTQDSVRTSVKIDGQPLPWDRYAAEFEEKMPQALRTFQEEIAQGATTRDHRKAIRERLRAIADLFQIPRYKATDEGAASAQDPTTGGHPAAKESGPTRPGGPPGTHGGTQGNLYSLFEQLPGIKAERLNSHELPEIEVIWVSVADGTRTSPDLEDRAARYDRRHNLLTISADFRGYVALTERWVKRYPRVPGARRAIEDLIGGWWQQALEETVLGVLALKGSEYWDERAVQAALSEEALTASAMQRYHLDAVARRELGGLLGTARVAA